jgi:hypothetical protein
MLLACALFAVSLAAPAAEAPPPPLLDVPAPVTPSGAPSAPPDIADTPAPASVDPAGAADAPPVVDPAAAPAAPPSPQAPRLTPEPDHAPAAAATAPMSPFTVGLVQWLVPCAIDIVGFPVGSVVPLAGGLFCLAVPGIGGYAATMFGDKYGGTRGPAIWPAVASYFSACLGTGAAGATLFALVASQGVPNASSPTLSDFGIAIGAGAGVGLLSGLLVPLAYALTSEPKHASDDGSGEPAWFAPGHPVVRPSHGEHAASPTAVRAMRF